MPERREKTGNGILEIDHAIKENRLFMDIILINPHNYSRSQGRHHEFTAEENKVERS